MSDGPPRTPALSDASGRAGCLPAAGLWLLWALAAVLGPTYRRRFMSILFSRRRRRSRKVELSPSKPRDDKQLKEQYDYVVVGGGTAGCVLAARLSEDGKSEVLLLEAGGPDTDPRIHTPREFEELQGTEFDWAYKLDPKNEPGLLPSDIRPVIPWPRGKVLGGSGSINALVYMRGNRRDFDHWAELTGDKGWSFDSVLPYFKKSERNRRAGVGDLHGTDGPFTVSDIDGPNPVSLAFVRAAREAGFDETSDFNDREQTGGAGLLQVTIDQDGKRVTTSTAYLTPEVRKRPNLTVATHALARRVLLEGKRAVGVEFVSAREPGQKKRTARARKEVVLCGGTVGSPLLLLHSGVGPADHLKEKGVEVRHNLQGVGGNLQDHAIAAVLYLYKEGQTSGPSNTGGVEGGMFIDTTDQSEWPDIQFHFTHKILGRPPAPPADAGYMIVSTLVRPRSRGYIRLRSSDPDDAPDIRANYLTDPDDLKSMVEGIKAGRKIGRAKPFDPYRGFEASPGDKATTDEQIAEVVRATAIGLYHPVGTCKMGKSPADGAVVDSELRVHGIEGLRVADASVMPTITAGNTNAATMMIAERAADLIRRGGQKKK
jgi:choline dehydrogenase